MTDIYQKFVTKLIQLLLIRFWNSFPGNNSTKPKEDLKGITTRSGVNHPRPKAVNSSMSLGDKGTLCLLQIMDLALPELTPTCMTLELADRSITEPIGIAKDRLTLRVLAEAMQHSTWTRLQKHKLLRPYDANKIDVIRKMACDEYTQEVLGFSNENQRLQPTPYLSLLFLTLLSPNLTPFGTVIFLLMEEQIRLLALEE
ncbi:hypothetical protein Tco_1316340 [Tanacetum coccineum]